MYTLTTEECEVAESALDIALNIDLLTKSSKKTWNEKEEKILNELIAKLYAIRMKK